MDHGTSRTLAGLARRQVVRRNHEALTSVHKVLALEYDQKIALFVERLGKPLDKFACPLDTQRRWAQDERRSALQALVLPQVLPHTNRLQCLAEAHGVSQQTLDAVAHNELDTLLLVRFEHAKYTVPEIAVHLVLNLLIFHLQLFFRLVRLEALQQFAWKSFHAHEVAAVALVRVVLQTVRQAFVVAHADKERFGVIVVAAVVERAQKRFVILLEVGVGRFALEFETCVQPLVEGKGELDEIWTRLRRTQ